MSMGTKYGDFSRKIFVIFQHIGMVLRKSDSKYPKTQSPKILLQTTQSTQKKGFNLNQEV